MVCWVFALNLFERRERLRRAPCKLQLQRIHRPRASWLAREENVGRCGSQPASAPGLNEAAEESIVTQTCSHPSSTVELCMHLHGIPARPQAAHRQLDECALFAATSIIIATISQSGGREGGTFQFRLNG